MPDAIPLKRQPVVMPASITAAELQAKVFEPVQWVVPDRIPAGLSILAAKPKIGKSWLMLATALAVADHGYILDKRCPQGDVLYCALEDGERRLKSRMAKIHSSAWPGDLTFWTEMQRIDAGGLDQLREWTRQVEKPRLIIIDTMAKVRGSKTREETQYESDYRAAGDLKRLADETGVAVILVHHVRKMAAEDDPLDAVSGTTGLTGAADTILVLKREASGVTLYARGRDIEEAELAVEFDKAACRWRLIGDASEVRISNERAAVLAVLREEGAPMTPKQIATALGKKHPTVRKLVTFMLRDGEVALLERGRYAPPN